MATVQRSQRTAGRARSQSSTRRRGLVKFVFWGVAAALVFVYAIQSYTSGEMVHWYYYQAKESGYAVNDRAVMDATPEQPIYLKVVAATEINGEINGLQAVQVKKGDILPRNATGVIGSSILNAGKRAALQGDELKVMIPYEVKESKGATYKDTFAHKGVQTFPYSGVWNLVMVVLTGLSLGFLAEAFTDMIGLQFRKPNQASGH